MKTTLDLDDDLIARAKARAARERKSLTRLIEEGLTLRLRQPAPAVSSRRRAIKVPVYHGKGGLVPGVDPLSNRSMLDAAYGGA